MIQFANRKGLPLLPFWIYQRRIEMDGDKLDGFG
jgi:hypothetical protein